MFHKLCWPCKGLVAEEHDRGYHAVYKFSSALHGDVTFCVLAEGLIISLPEL